MNLAPENMGNDMLLKKEFLAGGGKGEGRDVKCTLRPTPTPLETYYYYDLLVHMSWMQRLVFNICSVRLPCNKRIKQVNLITLNSRSPDLKM